MSGVADRVSKRRAENWLLGVAAWIGDFDRNYFDKVTKMKAVWNGFQKERENLDRR